MLDIFPEKQVDRVRGMVDATPSTDWPEVRTLGILFTSRSGSSHLGREIARRFAVGRIEESLNSPRINNTGGGADGLRKIITGDREGDWFAYKTGPHGLIVGELMGFLKAARARAVFIYLVRRDIVAQAVSLQKAQQTAYWHSTSAPSDVAPVYDHAPIARQVAFIEAGMRLIRAYLDRSRRPFQTLAYEDFQGGDMGEVERVCEALGLPRRDQIAPPVNPVEKTGDAVNEAWVARFNTEMDERTRKVIGRYGDLIGSVSGQAGRHISVP